MDKKAKDILFRTYWTAKGWTDRDTRSTDRVSYEYAKEKGLMFDRLTISKTELVDQLHRLVTEIPRTKITDAFLCSLTNKRLDWRSGLASYVNAQRLLLENDISDDSFGHGENIDLNVLNFERIKWGGVRHYNGVYNLLDLQILEKEIVTRPTKETIQSFKSILETIENSEIGEPPGKLRDRLKEVVKASKSELSTLMEILACAHILKPLRFDRKVPGKHDWTFVLHWRGEDKYDKQTIRNYFGQYGIE
ncbi:MAG: hypothetical protein JNL13_03665 [Chitinophagaceae bacterium]|nr:hypothetical protein [Chitinophagaceae bacterium]